MGARHVFLFFLIVLVLLGAYHYYYFIRSSGIVGIRVATTTSLYATGLLEYLAEKFCKKYSNVRLEFIAVGSGEALRRAEMGDVSMVFVHAPSLEKIYIDNGVLVAHRIIAYNYFVLVGPSSDPADIRDSENAIEAFIRLYRAGEAGRAVFVSRGDSSGTHIKELSLWRSANLNPRGRSWYRESGAGMGQTLIIANELGAYTLSDIGTFLKFKKKGRIPNLEVLYANSTELINIYSVYIVSSSSGSVRSYAELFANFIYENQNLIATYGVEEYGQPLFYPAKGLEEKLYSLWLKLAGG